MWTATSAGMRSQLAQSHIWAGKINVLHGGRAIASLAPSVGQVAREAGRAVFSNMNATLTDPTGVLNAEEVNALLTPADTEIAVYRGCMVNGKPEYAPMGIFQLTEREVTPQGAVAVVGLDRAVMYQGGMTGSVVIPGNTRIEDAIIQVLASRNRNVSMIPWRTGYFCGPLVYSPEINVWDAALDLAKAAGGTLYHNRIGQLIFAPSLPVSNRPVGRWATGDGLLKKTNRKEKVDGIHNIVVVQSTKTATGGMIEAVAQDLNPKSPTFTGGRYGRRPAEPIINQHITSVQQAQQIATIELARELGHLETIDITGVPDCLRDPMDMVTLNVPAKKLYERNVVIESLAVPLGVRGEMTVVMRQSIITADGKILPIREELA